MCLDCSFKILIKILKMNEHGKLNAVLGEESVHGFETVLWRWAFV